MNELLLCDFCDFKKVLQFLKLFFLNFCLECGSGSAGLISRYTEQGVGIYSPFQNLGYTADLNELLKECTRVAWLCVLGAGAYAQPEWQDYRGNERTEQGI